MAAPSRELYDLALRRGKDNLRGPPPLVLDNFFHSGILSMGSRVISIVFVQLMAVDPNTLSPALGLHAAAKPGVRREQEASLHNSMQAADAGAMGKRVPFLNDDILFLCPHGRG